jgi:ABC-type phosphate transport system permease subunit
MGYFKIGLIVAGIVLAIIILFIIPTISTILAFMKKEQIFYQERYRGESDFRSQGLIILLAGFWVVSFLVWPFAIAILVGFGVYKYFFEQNEKFIKIIKILSDSDTENK